MVPFKNLTVSIEAGKDIDPTVERWLDEVHGLQRRLSERVVLLCRYFDRIPEQALLEYANALLVALKDEDLEEEFSVSTRLNERIAEFVNRLEESGDVEQARSISEAIETRLNSKR